MSRKADDVLLRAYAESRDLRDRVRTARNGCLCYRHEGVDQSGEPCWKSARQWESNDDPERFEMRRFYFDPPMSEWCVSCRQRQEFTEQLRTAVKAHAAAKRAILQRGRALCRAAVDPPGEAPASDS